MAGANAAVLARFDEHLASRPAKTREAYRRDVAALAALCGPKPIARLKRAELARHLATLHGRGRCLPKGCSESTLPLKSTLMISPGSTWRTNSAPTTSKATVSEANTVASPIRPICSGRMPSGSRQAIMPSGVITISA